MSKSLIIFLYISSLILSATLQGVLAFWFPTLISDDGKFTFYLLLITSLIILGISIKDVIQNKNKLVGITFLIISTIIITLSLSVLMLVTSL